MWERKPMSESIEISNGIKRNSLSIFHSFPFDKQKKKMNFSSNAIFDVRILFLKVILIIKTVLASIYFKCASSGDLSKSFLIYTK